VAADVTAGLTSGCSTPQLDAALGLSGLGGEVVSQRGIRGHGRRDRVDRHLSTSTLNIGTVDELADTQIGLASFGTVIATALTSCNGRVADAAVVTSIFLLANSRTCPRTASVTSSPSSGSGSALETQLSACFDLLSPGDHPAATRRKPASVPLNVGIPGVSNVDLQAKLIAPPKSRFATSWGRPTTHQAAGSQAGRVIAEPRRPSAVLACSGLSQRAEATSFRTAGSLRRRRLHAEVR
jgi:hypothetical protein